MDPRKIKVPEIRVTSAFDEETRAQFEATIRDWGIETPVLCFEIDGDLVLVDGKNRLDEAIVQGIPQVDVVVRPGDMVQVLTRNIFLDNLRGKHKVTDMIRVLKSLSDDYKLDTDQIAEQTLKNRDYVERLLKIATASPAVLDALDQGAIGVAKAFQISRLPHPEQQERVTAVAIQYGDRLPTAELKAQVDAILEEMGKLPPRPEPAERPTQLRVFCCEGCKQEVDPRYVRPALLCPRCFGNVWELGKVAVTGREEVSEARGGD